MISNQSGIYKITSILFPGRVYVGSAKNLRKRQQSHLNDLTKRKHGNRKLQCHVNKYGVKDLVFSTVEYCDVCLLIKKEQFYIDSLNPSFNICRIAGSTIGRPQSVETRMKRSLSMRGKTPFIDNSARFRMSLAKKKAATPDNEVNYFVLIARGLFGEGAGRKIKNHYQCMICGKVIMRTQRSIREASCECRRVYPVKVKPQRERSPIRYNVKRKDNTSGFPGITWDSSAGVWRARIKLNGKLLDAGRYPTATEAHQARQDKLKQMNLPIREVI